MNAEPGIPIPHSALRIPQSAGLARLWPVSGAAASIAPVDGLRGIAVLLTIGLHTLLWWQLAPHGGGDGTALLWQHPLWAFGATGVHLFFVLSGFLLFLPYARAACGLQAFPDTWKFYTRRALRILPAYWVSLVLIVGLGDPRFRAPAQWPDLLAHLFLMHDARAATLTSINPPYWTMAVESHFYLLLPLLAWGFWRLVRAGRLWRAGGLYGLLLASAPAYGVLVWLSAHYAPTLYLYPALELVGYLTVFAAGMGCSVLFVLATERDGVAQAGRQGFDPGRWSAAAMGAFCRWAGIVGIFSLGSYALLSLVLPIWHPGSALYWLVGNPLLGLGYAGVLMGVLVGWPRGRRMLAAPGMRFVGLISYSLYIWNWPLDQIISAPVGPRFGTGPAALLAETLLGAAILIPFGFVFYTLVERPFIRVRGGCR